MVKLADTPDLGSGGLGVGVCLWHKSRKRDIQVPLRAEFDANRIKKNISASMVKLADTPDLGSGAERRGGSSPSTRTTKFRLAKF